MVKQLSIQFTPQHRVRTGRWGSGDGVGVGGGEWEGADETLPVTSIQIRLRDGSRVVARFNYSHTIRDIRRFDG